MNSKKTANSLQHFLIFACGSCIVLIIILIINRDYPIVGHDYAYFIPHIIDTDLHIRINGFSIQWYTPSFGGGLPGFPNPQHMEYSFVQLLSLLMNPWSAVLVSTAIISLIGYYFFYRFLHENLELDWMTSTLGAMFFIGNGFYIEHMIAGQLGYQLFPLGAVILYALSDRRSNYLYNAAMIAAVITLMVFQAGFYLIIILVLSLSITLPILYLYKPQKLDLKKISLTVISAMVLSGMITASKVYAILAFMRHFPRQIFDAYDVGLLQAIVGLITQLLGAMILQPILMVARHFTVPLSSVFISLTGARYGLWELDTGLSPVLFIFLFSGLVQALVHIQRRTWPTFNLLTGLSFVLLVLALWITSEMTLARGIIYTTTKQLPLLRSLHVNVRFASAFILPLIIVGVFQLNSFFYRNSKPLYFFVLAIFTVVPLFTFFYFPSEEHLRFFDVRPINSFYEKMQNGSKFPIADIRDIDPKVGFSEYSSCCKPYEPIFGYKLEEFKPEIHVGSVFEQDHGYFNMTNPTGFVFPEINNTRPFERIKISERDKLETFLERRQPTWNIPIEQKILNWLSLIAVLTNFGILFAAGLARVTAVIQTKQTN